MFTEIFGDIWDYYQQPNTVILITTNGDVTKAGKAVMGRGVALQAKTRIPKIDKTLGRFIKWYGNRVLWLEANEVTYSGMMSFPVKHHWREKADLELIKKSALDLKELAEKDYLRDFILPRPGCSNGGRSWILEVAPLLRSLDLPENILVISPEKPKIISGEYYDNTKLEILEKILDGRKI